MAMIKADGWFAAVTTVRWRKQGGRCEKRLGTMICWMASGAAAATRSTGKNDSELAVVFATLMVVATVNVNAIIFKLQSNAIVFSPLQCSHLDISVRWIPLGRATADACMHKQWATIRSSSSTASSRGYPQHKCWVPGARACLRLKSIE